MTSLCPVSRSNAGASSCSASLTSFEARTLISAARIEAVVMRAAIPATAVTSVLISMGSPCMLGYSSLSVGNSGRKLQGDRGRRIPRHRIDHRDLLDREVGDDLDLVLVDDQHLLDSNTPLELLAVLGLEREHHAFLDLDRVVERPDARDDRLVVLRETEAVSPQVRRGLVLLRVAPGFLRRGPFRGDLPRGRAHFHRLDRVVQPLERRSINIFLLQSGLLPRAVGAVVAGLVAVPCER